MSLSPIGSSSSLTTQSLLDARSGTTSTAGDRTLSTFLQASASGLAGAPPTGDAVSTAA